MYISPLFLWDLEKPDVPTCLVNLSVTYILKKTCLYAVSCSVVINIEVLFKGKYVFWKLWEVEGIVVSAIWKVHCLKGELRDKNT